MPLFLAGISQICDQEGAVSIYYEGQLVKGTPQRNGRSHPETEGRDPNLERQPGGGRGAEEREWADSEEVGSRTPLQGVD